MEQRELETRYLREVKVAQSTDIYREMRDIKMWQKEAFVVFCLDAAGYIVSREIVSIGILDSSLVHAREVFRTAILRNACSIIIAHNHPSGIVEPSSADQETTGRLREAGELLGIRLLDHVVVGPENYFSFSDQGEF
jgi:DNA repair protein RadC